MFVTAARLITHSSAFFSILIAFFSAAACWLWLSTILDKPGPHANDSVVIVDAGSGHALVRLELHRAGVLHQNYHYDAARMLAGKNLYQKLESFCYQQPRASAKLWIFCTRVKACNVGEPLLRDKPVLKL